MPHVPSDLLTAALIVAALSFVTVVVLLVAGTAAVRVANNRRPRDPERGMSLIYELAAQRDEEGGARIGETIRLDREEP